MVPGQGFRWLTLYGGAGAHVQQVDLQTWPGVGQHVVRQWRSSVVWVCLSGPDGCGKANAMVTIPNRISRNWWAPTINNWRVMPLGLPH